MRNFLFCCCVLLYAFDARNAAQKKEYVFRILPESHIRINGSSNVNTFCCRVNHPAGVTPLRIAIRPDYSVQMAGSITVNVSEFDCKNPILTNDLRKTLKADAYKQMTVHFKSLDQLPFDTETEETVSGTILIELAGKQREFAIPLTFTQIAEGKYQLKGSRDFSFEDFDLKAPKKIGGLIRVRNKFTTVFVLNLVSP